MKTQKQTFKQKARNWIAGGLIGLASLVPIQANAQETKPIEDTNSAYSVRLRTENEQIKNDLDQLQQEKQSNRELSKRLDDYEQNQSELLRVMNLLQNGNARLKNSPTGEVHVTLVHD